MSEAVTPDPTKVQTLVEALAAFLPAIAPSPSMGPPDQPAAIEAANVLQNALDDLLAVELPVDGPDQITAGGLIASYAFAVSGTLATIMNRSGDSLVEGAWVPSRSDDDLPIFAYPSEVRGMEDAARGLAEAIEILEKRGPQASMNPLDDPEPIRRPNLVHLESLCNATAHWLEISRLREGEEPDDERRGMIINAVQFMNVFLGQNKLDVRWASIPRFQILYLGTANLSRFLVEMMRRGHLYWDGEAVEVLDHGPLYLDPEESTAVERAHRDLWSVLERLRGEAAEKAEAKPNRTRKPRKKGAKAEILAADAIKQFIEVCSDITARTIADEIGFSETKVKETMAWYVWMGMPRDETWERMTPAERLTAFESGSQETDQIS